METEKIRQLAIIANENNLETLELHSENSVIKIRVAGRSTPADKPDVAHSDIEKMDQTLFNDKSSPVSATGFKEISINSSSDTSIGKATAQAPIFPPRVASEVSSGKFSDNLAGGSSEVTSSSFFREISDSSLRAAGIGAEQQDSYEVKSPMVGVFYAAPSPDDEPYVKVGSKVKKGDVLCIIEAMKLLNEITSDKDGTLVKIYVENGEVVEFAQPLFEIL